MSRAMKDVEAKRSEILRLFPESVSAHCAKALQTTPRFATRFRNALRKNRGGRREEGADDGADMAHKNCLSFCGGEDDVSLTIRFSARGARASFRFAPPLHHLDN